MAAKLHHLTFKPHDFAGVQHQLFQVHFRRLWLNHAAVDQGVLQCYHVEFPSAPETPSLRHTGIVWAVLFTTNSIVGRRRQLQVRHRLLGNIQASLSENGWCAWEEFNHGWNISTTNTSICIDNHTVITHAHTDTHTQTRIVLHYITRYYIALILHYCTYHYIALRIALRIALHYITY